MTLAPTCLSLERSPSFLYFASFPKGDKWLVMADTGAQRPLEWREGIHTHAFPEVLLPAGEHFFAANRGGSRLPGASSSTDGFRSFDLLAILWG